MNGCVFESVYHVFEQFHFEFLGNHTFFSQFEENFDNFKATKSALIPKPLHEHLKELVLSFGIIV